jgi:CDGSH-type Zn-finger protein
MVQGVFMAEFTNEDRNGHVRTYIKIEPGERIKLCRCSKSSTYPFCDSTHKTLDIKEGPVIIEVVEKKLV